MESVAGHLRERNGIYYIVLSYTDLDGKRKTPMITTRLPVKGNKKRAEKLLSDARNEKEAELKYLRKAQKNGYRDENVEFTAFLAQWLKMMRKSVEDTTFAGYDTKQTPNDQASRRNASTLLFFQVETKKYKNAYLAIIAMCIFFTI